MLNGYGKKSIVSTAAESQMQSSAEMRTMSATAASMSCHDIFQALAARQTNALVFHDTLADVYDFLGLMGFKRLHEYQYLSEAAERRGLKRYYINHHSKLLQIVMPELDVAEVMPTEWLEMKRLEVSQSARKQFVEQSFEMYRAWEDETKYCYEEYAKMLLDKGHVADFDKVSKLVCDVDQELKSVDRMLVKMKAVGFNEVYLMSIQDEMHEKYKAKTKEIGIYIC